MTDRSKITILQNWNIKLSLLNAIFLRFMLTQLMISYPQIHELLLSIKLLSFGASLFIRKATYYCPALFEQDLLVNYFSLADVQANSIPRLRKNVTFSTMEFLTSCNHAYMMITNKLDYLFIIIFILFSFSRIFKTTLKVTEQWMSLYLLNLRLWYRFIIKSFILINGF